MRQARVADREKRQLRIIHFVRAPIGGIFRHVLDLSAEQAAAGHRVGIVLDSSTGGVFEADKIAAAAPHLALGVTRLPISRKVRPADLIAAWRVYNVVKAMRPDVLHGHGAKGGVLARFVGTLLSTRAHPVARLYTPHGGSLHFPKAGVAGRFYFGVERLFERLCDGLIHVSRYEADAYREKVGMPRCGASIVLNGLRHEEFGQVAADDDARDLLFMGMMRDLKGPDVLIRAIAAVRERTGRTPTASLLGEGPDLDACRQLAAELGLSSAIAFQPSMPTRQGLRRGRIMVVPSRAESMPYIVLEAIAAGLPLIATRVGGIPEIVGRTDRLVPPGDVAALADAIERALANPVAVQAEAIADRAVLRTRFTVESMAEAVERLYVGILDYRRGERGAAPLSSLQPAE